MTVYFSVYPDNVIPYECVGRPVSHHLMYIVTIVMEAIEEMKPYSQLEKKVYDQTARSL